MLTLFGGILNKICSLSDLCEMPVLCMESRTPLYSLDQSDRACTVDFHGEAIAEIRCQGVNSPSKSGHYFAAVLDSAVEDCPDYSKRRFRRAETLETRLLQIQSTAWLGSI